MLRIRQASPRSSSESQRCVQGRRGRQGLDLETDTRGDRLLGHAAQSYFPRVTQGEHPSTEEYAERFFEMADGNRATSSAFRFTLDCSAREFDSNADAPLSKTSRAAASVRD